MIDPKKLLEWAQRVRPGFGLDEIAAHIQALLRERDDLIALLRGTGKALDEAAGAFGGHNSHWDSTMRHGAGCEQCHRQHAARDNARAALARLAAFLASAPEDRP
jgi:hypothetical protein